MKKKELSDRQIEVLKAINPHAERRSWTLGDLGNYFSIPGKAQQHHAWRGLVSTLRSLDRAGLIKFVSYEVSLTPAGKKRAAL